MIIPMHKYTFFVYHEEYTDFLKNMHDLGVLHVIEKQKEEIVNEDIDQKQKLITTLNQTIKFLEKREIEKREIEKSNASKHSDGYQIVEDIKNKQKELTELQQKLEAAKKELTNTEPWGDFSTELIHKLNNEGLVLRFFSISKKRFDENKIGDLFYELISEFNNRIYFVVFQENKQDINIEAEEQIIPQNSISEIKKSIIEIEEQIQQIEDAFDEYAATTIPLLINTKNEILSDKQYYEVVENTTEELEGKMKVLEGWVPKSKKDKIDKYLKDNEIVFFIDKAKTDEAVPVLLKNNKFGKLFEPIGKLFSLPSYSELDLTVFFAPFFMMFFGFCLGDAGYGLLFIFLAGLYKLKAKKELKPLLSLVQLLGAATVIFGVISGTFFGINLIQADFEILKNYKNLFLEPDNMFNLALAIGAIQIVFGMIIKAGNQIKQYGFKHALATFGWLISLLGSGVYFALVGFELIASNNIILYSILSLGGILIVFFSDVNIGIFARIGKGVWDIYSTTTGIFGDLLSYIRLFALGLSSAILGFVINDIGLQILGSSPIIGPVLFVIFLVLGHGLNILISSLGSFVHPMRLTFVEFYKNAGFQGGGKEYNPFSKKISTK